MQTQQQQSYLTKFDQLHADIVLFVAPAMTVKVADKESADKALEVARNVKSYLKKVEDKRTELVKPHNEIVKSINAYAKSIAGPLEKAEFHIKQELSAYEYELENKRREEMRKAEEERKRLQAEADAKAKEREQELEVMNMFGPTDESARAEVEAQVEKDREMMEVQQIHKTNVKSIESMKVSGATKRWTFSVVNQELVPREFLIVNETAIRAAIRAGTREIAGVNIFQETSVAIR